MALIRYKDAYPDQKAMFGRGDNAAEFSEYSVYAQGEDKVGTVEDALFEQATGNIRYLVVDTGFWVFGKKVLIPIGLTRFDHQERRVYVNGLTQERVENLPEYTNDMTVDHEYEDRIRTNYRDLGEKRQRQFMGKPYNVDKYRAYPGSAELYGAQEYTAATTSTDAYQYESEPGLYGMSEEDHQPIRLYQERLIADKDRYRSGAIAIGKRVETETKEVSVPVENERIIIERTPVDSRKPVSGSPNFKEGEVLRVETYAEEADIHKEAFVREEVNVRKTVDRDTVTAQETVRREELDLNQEGTPKVSRS